MVITSFIRGISKLLLTVNVCESRWPGVQRAKNRNIAAAMQDVIDVFIVRGYANWFCVGKGNYEITSLLHYIRKMTHRIPIFTPLSDYNNEDLAEKYGR